MCSWCWGFSPVLRRLHSIIQTQAKFHVIMGGLRPGLSQPWDQDMRTYIRHHWQTVSENTGQPFDFARFDDLSFVYNTEPACRAVVTVRRIQPDAALHMFEAIQDAFYARGQDVTNTDILADIAQHCTISRDAFLDLYLQDSLMQLTRNDFNLTRQFGVSGYPTVLFLKEENTSILTSGYQSFDSLARKLDEWLNT